MASENSVGKWHKKQRQKTASVNGISKQRQKTVF
jgi:hypothetical protein